MWERGVWDFGISYEGGAKFYIHIGTWSMRDASWVDCMNCLELNLRDGDERIDKFMKILRDDYQEMYSKYHSLIIADLKEDGFNPKAVVSFEELNELIVDDWMSSSKEDMNILELCLDEEKLNDWLQKELTPQYLKILESEDVWEVHKAITALRDETYGKVLDDLYSFTKRREV
jgi:hypothetical protein